MTDTTLLEARLADIQEDVGRYQEKLTQVRLDIDNARAEKNRIDGHIEVSNTTLGTLSQDVYDLNAQKADIQSQITILETKKVGVENELSDLKLKLEAIKTQFDEKISNARLISEKEIATIIKNKAGVQSALDEISALLETAKTALATTTAKNMELVDENKKIDSEIDKKKIELKVLSDSIETIKLIKSETNAKIEAENGSLLSKNKELKNENGDLVTSNEYLKQENQALIQSNFALTRKEEELNEKIYKIDTREKIIRDAYIKAGIPYPE